MSIKGMFGRLFGSSEPKRPPISEPLRFEARPGSAYDPVTGVTIPEPRLIAGVLRDGARVTEYHYAFYRDGQVVGRLGLYGSDTLKLEQGGMERQFFLYFGHDWLIRSLLELKQTLGHTGDDYAFVCGLVEGMLRVYETQPDVRGHQRYLAIADHREVLKGGLQLPTHKIAAFGGLVLFADLVVARKLDALPERACPAITDEQVLTLMDYLQAPGSGVTPESSFAEYLEQKIKQHPPVLPPGKDYVFCWGIDEESKVNHQTAAEYAKDTGGGVLGDSDLGRFIDDLSLNPAGHPEFEEMVTGLRAFMDARGALPLNGKYRATLHDIMWTAGRGPFMEAAIKRGKPLVAYVNEYSDDPEKSAP